MSVPFPPRRPPLPFPLPGGGGAIPRGPLPPGAGGPLGPLAQLLGPQAPPLPPRPIGPPRIGPLPGMPMGGPPLGPSPQLPPGFPMPRPGGMPLPMGMPGMGAPQAPPPPPQNPLESPEFWLQLIQQMEQDDTARQQGTPEKQNTKPKRKKPDQNKVRQRIDRVIDEWQNRDRRMREDEGLYQLNDTSSGDGEVVISNIPQVVVNKAANLIATQTPIHTIKPPQADLRELAQSGENLLRYAWTVWNRQWRLGQTQGNIDWALGHYVALRGWITCRIQYNPEAEDREFPVDLFPYDPITVYPKLGRKGLQYVVHKYEISAGELVDEWPEAEKDFGDVDDTQRVTVEAYYDDWYHTVYADSKVIKPLQEHEYGFTPWVIATGYGSPLRATESSSNGWDEFVGVSIFHSIRDVYAQLNRILSQVATDVAKAANPPVLYYYDPANPDEPKPLNLNPGAVNFMIYDREKAEPLNLSPKPSDIGPLVEKLLGDIQKGSLPDILWGAGAGPSGFTSSILTDTARDALFPLTSAIEFAKEQINRYTLMLIRDQHTEPVGFFVKDRATGEWSGDSTISPAEIEELGTENEVRYRDIAPKDRAALAQMAVMLTDKKLISMETARDELLGLENPERENERVLTDLIYLDESVTKEVLVPMALARAEPEMFQLWAISKKVQQMMEQMGGAAPPNGPAGPAGPPAGGPPPGMPGIPALSGPPPPSLGPTALPPIMQPNANPIAQSLGSILGGAGLQRPPGIPGAGAPPIAPPLV